MPTKEDEKEVREKIESIHFMMGRMMGTLDEVRNDVSEIKDGMEGHDSRIRNLEGFKGKLIGIGVAVSTLLGIAGSAIFNALFPRS